MGAFAALILGTTIGSHESFLQSWGSVLVQDILMPLRLKPLAPNQHLRWLRFSSLGVAIDRLPVAQPNSAEEALEVVRRLAASGAVDLLVVDSAAALVPQIELATGIGAGGGGAHSRALASGLRRMAVAMRRSGAVVLFLNQTRVRPERTGDTAETAAGGPALKLFAALRIAMSRAAPGGAVALRALKNKASGAFAECELRWRDGAGFTESP